MTCILGCPKRTLPVLLIGVTSWFMHHSALAQPAADSSRGPAGAKADAKADFGRIRRWTCAMHPQVRQNKTGKCPICAMAMTPVSRKVADGTPKLIGLQEMLAIALKHNPDVRAAQARVQAAEAERDRTRFDVLQQIMAFRDKWEKQKATLNVALREYRNAQTAVENADVAKRPAAEQIAAAAREKHFLLRAKLAEVEAELPFVLGRAPGQAIRPADSRSSQLILDELLPKARQMLELRIREYQVGKASMLDVAAAHRQITELEVRLAETNTKRIAVVESKKGLLQTVREIAAERYKAGRTGQGDVLAIELELSKLELWLLDLKDE